MHGSLAFFAAASVFAASPVFAQFPAQGFPGATFGQQAQLAVAPQDLPYTNNLVSNPGFEKGLGDDPAKGWASRIKNDAETKAATIMPNAGFQAFEGKKALHLKIKSPVKFPSKFLDDPNYGTFLQTANKGKGPNAATVLQTVPVTPGKLYALRFRWRGSELRKPSVDPGPERGYAQFEFKGTWVPAKGKKPETLPQVKMPPIWTDSAEWKTVALPDLAAAAMVALKTKKPPQPAFIRAPQDVSAITLSLSLTSCTPGLKPEIWVDRFEFAEVEPEALKAALKGIAAALPKPAAK